MTTSLPRSLLLGLSLVLAACGGEGLTLPPDGAAANIEVTWGSGQSARVGSTLPDSLVVKVTDTRGRPVEGANVVFDFTADGSAASPATASTDANGIAWSRLVLGTRVGLVNGTARVPTDQGVTPVSTTFTATVLAGDANGIALVSGDGQSAPVNSALPAPLVVVVTDQDGNPISNVTISWSVTGGGSVSLASTVTDANGQTSVTRTLGPTAGAQTTVATAALAGSPITFTHTATAGSAARVVVVDGNGQSAPAGTKLPKELVVQLLDDQNNPIPGRPVSWVVGIGGGSASPETSTTDGNGQARTEWTLGPNPGPNTLTGVVSGVGNGLFNATGTKVSSATTITSHTPEPSIVGTPVSVGVSVTGPGGTPTGQVTVAGEGALASCTITLANGSGSCPITFAQTGNRDVTATYSGDTRFAGSSDTQKHQVSPAPNAAPVAGNDTYSATEDLALTVVAPGVLSNDNDPEGGPLTAVNASNPANGSVVLSENGSFTYTPDPDFSGADGFTYSARDAAGSTTSATVTINVAAVNDAPVAQNDAYTTAPGGSLSVVAPGVLGNDSDDGSVITAVLAGGVTNGILTLNADGSFTYQANPGATSDSFTYRAKDAQGVESADATVTITVQ